MNEELNHNINFNIFTIIGLILVGIGLFFFVPNLTGNATGNLNASITNILGIALFVLGLVVVYFSFKKK
ncbi:MAG: hypothetical protein AABW51_03810 [Nanoarchaeota archaeon]